MRTITVLASAVPGANYGKIIAAGEPLVSWEGVKAEVELDGGRVGGSPKPA
jgi:hypothetical protein